MKKTARKSVVKTGVILGAVMGGIMLPIVVVGNNRFRGIDGVDNSEKLHEIKVELEKLVESSLTETDFLAADYSASAVEFSDVTSTLGLDFVYPDLLDGLSISMTKDVDSDVLDFLLTSTAHPTPISASSRIRIFAQKDDLDRLHEIKDILTRLNRTSLIDADFESLIANQDVVDQDLIDSFWLNYSLPTDINGLEIKFTKVEGETRIDFTISSLANPVPLQGFASIENFRNVGEKFIFRNTDVVSGELTDRSVDYFKDSSIKNIVFETNNLLRIKDDQFKSAQISNSVALPDPLIEIGESAFAYSGLESISFPDTLKYIGPYAFFNTQNLSGHIQLPSSLTVLGTSAFSNITLGNPAIDRGKIESVTIPGSLKEIPQYAFDGNIIKTIIIEDGVEIINEGAFRFNTIENLDLPNTLLRIEKDAFVSRHGELGNAINIPEMPASLVWAAPGSFYNRLDLDDDRAWKNVYIPNPDAIVTDAFPTGTVVTQAPN